MASSEPKPSEQRPPDLEIGASARAERVRFGKRPRTEVEFRGESITEKDTGSERRNLPDEVEPDVTYRDARIGWRAAAWIENAADEPSEGERG